MRNILSLMFQMMCLVNVMFHFFFNSMSSKSVKQSETKPIINILTYLSVMNKLLPKLDVGQHNEIIILGLRSFLTKLKSINIKLKRYETESMQRLKKMYVNCQCTYTELHISLNWQIKISYKPFKLP